MADLAPLELEERLYQLRETPGAAPAIDQLRAAGELRSLARWLVTADADDAVWEGLADGLAALREQLPERDTSSRYARSVALTGPVAERAGYHPNVRSTHPLLGRVNPVAPPIEMHAEGDRAVGDLVFGPTHEGVPRCAHGGHIAAGFDIALGQAAAQAVSGGGLTGTLTVRYLGLTPIGVPLRYEAWLERIEGRKIFVGGELRTLSGPDQEARVTAEAEGIFIQIPKRELG